MVSFGPWRIWPSARALQALLPEGLPSRFQALVDVRRFGVGERVVPQSYSQLIFETTQTRMHERKLFYVGPLVCRGGSAPRRICTYKGDKSKFNCIDQAAY
jgi:hypothetical protein